MFNSDERSILAVERVDSMTVHNVTAGFVSASIQPVAIVVRERQHVVAYDIESNLVDLDQLRDAVAGLDLLLTEAVAAQLP